MIVYQVESREDEHVEFEHFRNKRKALKHAKSLAKTKCDFIAVTKMDTGKAKPFDLIKMFGDFDSSSFLVGYGTPHSKIPITTGETIFELSD